MKTGNESQQSLKEVIDNGYAVFDRNEFIDLLNKYEIDNDIHKDFKDRLLILEKLNNEWEAKIIKECDGHDWQCFSNFLKKESI